MAAIGLEYDPNKAYTVEELIDLRLMDYIDLINAIYKRGFIDSKHIGQLNSIVELWNSKLKYKLAKHFPIKLYKQDKFKLEKTDNKKAKGSRSNRIKELKEQSRKQSDEQLSLLTDVKYKLIDIDEIRYHTDVNLIFLTYCSLICFCLKDSLIKLDIILESQVNKSIKDQVLELKTKINKIIEISELWLQVQYRVIKIHFYLFLFANYFSSGFG